MSEDDIYSKINILDIFLSYRKKDEPIAKQFRTYFSNNNISTFDGEDIPAGVSFSTFMLTALRNSRIFMPLISVDFYESSWTMQELSTALEQAQTRNKLIVPILLPGITLENIPDELRLMIGRYQVYKLEALTDDAISRCVSYLAKNLLFKKAEGLAIERINEYINGGLTLKASTELCSITSDLCASILEKSKNGIPIDLADYILLFTYLEKIESIYDYSYGKEYRELTNKKLDLLSSVNTLLRTISEYCEDMLKVAVAIRILYYDREIRWQCADTITNGDASEGIVHPCPINEYVLKQAPYVKKYREGILSLAASEEKKEILGFISDSEKYIYDSGSKNTSHIKQAPTEDSPLSDTSDILKKIAEFIHEGNKLFDLIEEQTQASDFIKYLTASYERLKNYCELVGAKDIQAECIDRIIELKAGAEAKIQNEAPEKANEGIKALLGISSPKSGKYDLFISHKSEDYDIAEDMYGFFSSHLINPFLDKKSLPEMSEAEYKHSIMNALDGSTHFIVILSNLDYLYSKWVNVEMSTFHTEMIEGRKEDANFIFVVTDDVYRKIISSNKTVLPIEYRSFELMLVSEYKQKILSYIK